MNVCKWLTLRRVFVLAVIAAASFAAYVVYWAGLSLSVDRIHEALFKWTGLNPFVYPLLWWLGLGLFIYGLRVLVLINMITDNVIPWNVEVEVVLFIVLSIAATGFFGGLLRYEFVSEWASSSIVVLPLQCVVVVGAYFLTIRGDRPRRTSRQAESRT